MKRKPLKKVDNLLILQPILRTLFSYQKPSNPKPIGFSLIEALRKQIGISKNEAKKAVALFFYNMAEALASGDRVEIRGLCTFSVRNYKGYTSRNPKTGEKVQVHPKKQPFFKAGKEVKRIVDS